MGRAEDRDETAKEVAAFLGSGVAIMVATRDAELRPEIVRGWGPELRDDGLALDLCLNVPAGSAARANLEANGAIAINCTRPSTYRAMQIKGRVVEVRVPGERDLARAQDHAAAFTADTAKVGAPAPVAHYVGAIDLAVTVEIEELYDQTPGPAAGRRL